MTALALWFGCLTTSAFLYGVAVGVWMTPVPAWAWVPRAEALSGGTR